MSIEVNSIKFFNLFCINQLKLIDLNFVIVLYLPTLIKLNIFLKIYLFT